MMLYLALSDSRSIPMCVAASKCSGQKAELWMEAWQDWNSASKTLKVTLTIQSLVKFYLGMQSQNFNSAVFELKYLEQIPQIL